MLKSNAMKNDNFANKEFSGLTGLADDASTKIHCVQGTKTPIHVHEIFLNCCRQEFTRVEVVTKTGEIIDGVIDGYDKDTIVVHNEMTQMLIYKHAIEYISPRNGERLIIPENEMRHLIDSDKITVKNPKKV